MSPEPAPQSYLAFHKLTEGFPLEATCYPAERLGRLLDFLTENGFRLYDGSDKSEGEVVITFDDGYAHLADLLPLLIRRYKFRPIVFVPTFWIDRTNHWDFSHKLKPVNHLTSAQIVSLADQGVVFGSHGHSHTDLRRLNDRELKAELARSREILNDLTSQPVDMISYPFGRTNPRVNDAADEAGYSKGFTLTFPRQTDAPLATGRFAVYSWDTSKTVLRKLSQGRGYWFEQTKAKLTNLASGGTILLNRLKK